MFRCTLSNESPGYVARPAVCESPSKTAGMPRSVRGVGVDCLEGDESDDCGMSADREALDSAAVTVGVSCCVLCAVCCVVCAVVVCAVCCRGIVVALVGWWCGVRDGVYVASFLLVLLARLVAPGTVGHSTLISSCLLGPPSIRWLEVHKAPHSINHSHSEKFPSRSGLGFWGLKPSVFLPF